MHCWYSRGHKWLTRFFSFFFFFCKVVLVLLMYVVMRVSVDFSGVANLNSKEHKITCQQFMLPTVQLTCKKPFRPKTFLAHAFFSS